MFAFIDPMILSFAILFLTIAAFIADKVRMDIVAICSLLTLYITGLITSNQALAGFSNSTVITIAALFVVGEGLFQTGVADWLGERLLGLAGSSQTRLLVVLMLGAALFSGFLSNTGTVAVLLPAIVAAAWRIGTTPSKLLIPLAFAANIGGIFTLIGTPPNIVVSDALVAAGERPFGFFEFAWIGLPLLVVGILYIILLGRFLLPKRNAEDGVETVSVSSMELTETYLQKDKLLRLRVRSASPMVGKPLAEAKLGQDFLINVLQISRYADRTHSSDMLTTLAGQLRLLPEYEADVLTPKAETIIQADDLLLVEGEHNNAYRAALKLNLGVQSSNETDETTEAEYFSNEAGLAEVLITPRSTLIGETVVSSHFAKKYNVRVLGLRRRGEVLRQAIFGINLSFGDGLLVHGSWQDINIMHKEKRNFVVVGQPVRPGKQGGLSVPALTSLVIMSAMLILMITKLVPTVIAVLLTGLLMVIMGCLTMEQAYRAINWESIVLIAAMLPMSTALQETGGATFIADSLVTIFGGETYWLLGGVFLLTVIFTQVISNTATTVLLAPIAIGAAQDLGLSPHAVLMMVAVGASTAFVTPIASPVNMLVLNPGGYRFSDFIKVGLPLAIIFMVISVVLVPLIWSIGG